MILDKIVAHKKDQIEKQKRLHTMDELKEYIKRSNLQKSRDFYSAINKKGKLAIIAEVKKASPSKGIICHNFEPVRIASSYARNNVDAISVLTETEFFMGSDDYLINIRQNVQMPVLRKDFIIDCWQIYQSKALGADAILLIVSILNDEQLKKFQIIANILDMHCLVEVYNEAELTRALESGARIIGINNRNLQTFETTLKTTEKLIGMIPKDTLVVSESGIKDNADMKYLYSLGVNAVLIGESLVSCGNIDKKLNELRLGIGA